jgi:hypothetical protein
LVPVCPAGSIRRLPQFLGLPATKGGELQRISASPRSLVQVIDQAPSSASAGVTDERIVAAKFAA